jgi:hypothetical protein
MLAFPFQWAILDRTTQENPLRKRRKSNREAIHEAFEQGATNDVQCKQRTTQFVTADSTQDFLSWLATQPPNNQQRILLEILSALSNQVSLLHTRNQT